MAARIESIRQKLKAEANVPEAQRWATDERNVQDLENRALDGDERAAQFLELARDRMKRLRRERFEKTWGRLLNHPDATVELREHAFRSAELKRIRLLAHSTKYPALEQRANELLKAEDVRHEQRMKSIAADLASPAPTAEAAQ